LAHNAAAMLKGRWFAAAILGASLAVPSPAQAIPPWLGDRPAPDAEAGPESTAAEPEPEVEAEPAPERVPQAVETPPVARPAVPILWTEPVKTETPRRPLYKNWVFWTVAGSLVALAVVVTIAVTRDPPPAYPGTLGTVGF
jgi:hypothetical protein